MAGAAGFAGAKAVRVGLSLTLTTWSVEVLATLVTGMLSWSVTCQVKVRALTVLPAVGSSLVEL